MQSVQLMRYCCQFLFSHSVLRLILLLFPQHSRACTHLHVLTDPPLSQEEAVHTDFGKADVQDPFYSTLKLQSSARRGFLLLLYFTWHRNAAITTWLSGNSFKTMFPIAKLHSELQTPCSVAPVSNYGRFLLS